MHDIADVSVRPAVEADAQAIGTIHATALKNTIVKTSSSGEVVAANAGITDQAVASQWLYSISEPPSNLYFVMSALDGNDVVGFSALAPVEFAPDQPASDDADNNASADTGKGDNTGEGGTADDTDTTPLTLEIIALEVDSDHTGAGHGSRLLNASVDVAAQRGVRQIFVWISPDDEQRIRFFSDAGFAPAGARREFAVGDSSMDEHLWYTLIDD